jgi:phosphoserine phosphatase RsbU/P
MPIKVFIVDDNSSIFRNWTRMAAGKGGRYRVSGCSTGEEALRMAANDADIVLINGYLPTMDGFECARKLKARCPGLPVLMYATDWRAEYISGHMTGDLIFSAAHAGASGYLPKNLPIAEAARTIDQVLARARQRRRIFVTFFESKETLKTMARHWKKLAALLDASSREINGRRSWPRVTLTGKFEKARQVVETPLVYLEDFRQPFDFSWAAGS